jgi:hypothetical protein
MRFRNESKSPATVRTFEGTKPVVIVVEPGDSHDFPTGVTEAVMRALAPMLKRDDGPVTAPVTEKSPEREPAAQPTPRQKRAK